MNVRKGTEIDGKEDKRQEGKGDEWQEDKEDEREVRQ